MIDPLGENVIRFAKLKEVMEERLKEVDTFEDLIEMFKRLDKDGDGFIPTPEFKQYMRNMGMMMTQEQLDELMKEADGKNEGKVDIEELCTRLCPPKPK